MLIDEIKKANVQAMKDHDRSSRTAYSMVINRYQVMQTSGKGEDIGDKEVVAILLKFCKELEEELRGYLASGRVEAAEDVERQIAAVKRFSPEMLDEEKIREIIMALPDRSIPAVMKHFKANYDGQVDMSLVSKIARACLSEG